MVIWDRKKGIHIVEPDRQDTLLKVLYQTVPGRIILKLVVVRPWFSKLGGLYQKSRWSKKNIKPFVEKYNIDVSEVNLDSLKSFNDFFHRKKTIDITDHDEKHLLAIADSKLSVFKITESLELQIKDSIYTLSDIVGHRVKVENFKNGTCLVFRLTVDDYHRYHCVDNLVIKDNYVIKGEFHTVRPISEKYQIYKRNHREISIMETENFGNVVQVEVGATLVGCIQNNKKNEFKKMEERGYFEYGGSTIILLLNENIEIDKDLIVKTQMKTESKVRIGEKIGQVRVK